MTGRERISVAANDTLERVLDRLRSAQAGEIVLDVDERSPLLLSVPNLDSLEETAQRQGIQITVASTSSRVLNAARVFGLAVIDAAAAPAPARPRLDPNARLLAGEPLGTADAPVVGGVAVADADPAEPAKPARPAPVIDVKAITVGEDRAEMDDDDAAEEGWSAPAPTRDRPRHTRPDAAREPAGGRLDPYGQPYDEDEGDEGVTLPARRQRRPSPPTAAADQRDEEGWDEGLAGDDEADDDRDAPRPGLFDGLRAFWADVRARAAARRQPLPDEDEFYDETDEEAPAPGEVGAADDLDEPPYRARLARVAPPQVEQGISDDTGELPDPVPSRPPRTIRPFDAERFDAARQPTARLRPVPARYDDEADDGADEVDRRAGRCPASAGLVWGLILLLALALVGVVVAYILVPRATVTLVARTGTPEIGFNVVVGEIDPNSPQGQPTDERIVVPAKRIVVPITASASKPATGSRLIPDITAGGPVILANSSREAVSVPKGTVLTATDGRGYVTLDDAAVPPLDLATLALGSTEVKVAAQTRGSGGNAAVGIVRGTLANGIIYNNRDAPIAGGSDRRVATITKQDLAAAQAAAEDAARGKWQAAVNGAVPAGSQAMRETAGLGPFRVEFNTREGADGDSVTATVHAEATTLAFTPGEVEAHAHAEAERRIAGAAKPGEAIVPGSVQIGTPQLTADVPGTLTYRMAATARSRAAIGSDAERAQLANDLAHLSDDKAHDFLARLPGVSSATIDYDTGPFPHRLPWLASHIRVEVAER